MERAAAVNGRAKSAHLELPSWLRQPAPPQAPRAAPLSPSTAFDDEIGRTAHAGASAADRQKALQRGRIVHRLLQSLPDIAPAHRKDTAERYLDRTTKDLSSAERTEIARQVFAILDAPDFTEVFASGSRAEVPIVGRIARADGNAVAIAGQVDRLIVTDDAVLIADYKTDSAVPRRLDEVPPPYLAQVALYRAVISSIYPDKPVRAALIFTNAPVLLEMPAASMDRALKAELVKERHAPVKVP